MLNSTSGKSDGSSRTPRRASTGKRVSSILLLSSCAIPISLYRRGELRITMLVVRLTRAISSYCLKVMPLTGRSSSFPMQSVEKRESLRTRCLNIRVFDSELRLKTPTNG